MIGEILAWGDNGVPFKGLTQEQYQTASSRGHGGPRGSHVRSFWTQKNFFCPNDSILCPYLTSHVRMTPSRARMSAKSCEIARKFIGIRAIRGVSHGVTGSSEAKSLYDEWLNRGHGEETDPDLSGTN
eukprot:scaffold33263_cov70-Cyclotella_meneghiniana.AAC.17